MINRMEHQYLDLILIARATVRPFYQNIYTKESIMFFCYIFSMSIYIFRRNSFGVQQSKPFTFVTFFLLLKKVEFPPKE